MMEDNDKGKKPEGFLSGRQGTSGDIRNEVGAERKYHTGSYEKFVCTLCAQFGIEIPLLQGRHCRLCGHAINADGKPSDRRKGPKFEADRLEYLKDHPDIKETLKANETSKSKQAVPMSEGQAPTSKNTVSQTEQAPSVPKYIPPHKREGGLKKP